MVIGRIADIIVDKTRPPRVSRADVIVEAVASSAAAAASVSTTTELHSEAAQQLLVAQVEFAKLSSVRMLAARLVVVLGS